MSDGRPGRLWDTPALWDAALAAAVAALSIGLVVAFDPAASLEDGGKLLLRLMADSSINGRQMFLAPRKWASDGYLDLDLDDFEDGTFLADVQEDQMKGAPVEEGLFLKGRW